MRGSATNNTPRDFVVIHPLDPEDVAITNAMRATTRSSKGVRLEIEARAQFYTLMESVLPRNDVTFDTDTIGGVSGLWVRPADWRSDEAIIHQHGGWFNFGSAKAFAILSAISRRVRERGRLSLTIGSLPNILFPRLRTMYWLVTRGWAREEFTELLLQALPEAILHWDWLRGSRA